MTWRERLAALFAGKEERRLRGLPNHVELLERLKPLLPTPPSTDTTSKENRPHERPDTSPGAHAPDRSV